MSVDSSLNEGSSSKDGERHSDLAHILMLAPGGFASGWMRGVKRIKKKKKGIKVLDFFFPIQLVEQGCYRPKCERLHEK